MTNIASICVYCGSGAGNDPAFRDCARAFGHAMAEHGIGLVYGGGTIGLMGTIAEAVLDGGGQVTGIMPDFLKSREKLLDRVQETIIVPDMHSRKQLMFEKADAFVALPGGVGTLEELVEQMTWAQLGQHDKPVLLANIAGFWSPLVELLRQMQRERFIRSGMEVSCLVANEAKDIVPMLQRAAAERPQPVLDKPADAALRQM
jgi:uncharacterized protein (TIGR00730 family)